eukprot:Skav226561  [mRNA]  locus=scaffold1701:23035:33019:- [translate_table: standard]
MWERSNACIWREKRAAVSGHALTFIAKPRAAARGNGIFLFQVRASDVRAPRNKLKEVLDSEKMVVQSFLSKPLLIDGYKWDMRVYVLVTDVHPLTVYLYTDGLARFCTDLYEAPEEENLDMREMHLTNFSINWESDAFETWRRVHGPAHAIVEK